MHFVAQPSKAARFPIETRTYTPLKKLLAVRSLDSSTNLAVEALTNV
jgi:hypothetical protein